MKKIHKNDGNILMVGLVFVSLAIIIFLFIIGVFLSHINTILYHLKLNMYTMNRSAVIAVNKNKANVDNFSYDKNIYQKEFIRLLKINYELDEQLKNEDKLISSMELKEYEIYEAHEKDGYTGKYTDARMIHTVLKVKIKPIIMKSFLENIFIFDVHEDVKLNMIEEK